MEQISIAAERVRASHSLARLLDAGFDAFEVIRSAARACEDRDPDLFAAFMMAATAAVEGRNALNDAPSLPPSGGPAPAPPPSLDTDAAQIAESLAALGVLLAASLSVAAAGVSTSDRDRAACETAARAAREVHRLLAAGDDETATW